MISLVLAVVWISMLAVGVYGYLTDIEEVIGKMMILLVLSVLTGVVGILNSNL